MTRKSNKVQTRRSWSSFLSNSPPSPLACIQSCECIYIQWPKGNAIGRAQSSYQWREDRMLHWIQRRCALHGEHVSWPARCGNPSSLCIEGICRWRTCWKTVARTPHSQNSQRGLCYPGSPETVQVCANWVHGYVITSTVSDFLQRTANWSINHWTLAKLLFSGYDLRVWVKINRWYDLRRPDQNKSTRRLKRPWSLIR